MNPFYRGPQVPGPMLPGPLGNMQQMLQQWNQFKQTFRGDPQQRVQELLQSGQMTQEQYQKICQMANMYQGMFR